MADSELMSKLAKQRQKVGSEEDQNLEEKSQNLDLNRNNAENGDNRSVNGHGAENGHDEHHDAEANVVSDSASSELKNRLARRQDINEGRTNAQFVVHASASIYSEFHEFSRKQIKEYEKTFKRFDINGDGWIDFEELKHMMEKLGEPQTHLALKEMIREVDEDQDNRISFREFLLIFRKAAAGELLADSGLGLLASMTAIDVTKEGVGGAKNFFEAKIDHLTKSNAFEQEIKEEQAQKRQELEEKKVRKQEFKAKQSIFA